jgi:hypothetical protein
VRLFAAVNGWEYKAVSLDAEGVSAFDAITLDRGISDLFEIRAVPSVFIVNPTEKKAYPVGAGLLAVSEIEQNIERQIGALADEKK